MPKLEQPRQPAHLSRARLEQLEQLHTENQSEEDEDDWSIAGINGEIDEHQDEMSGRKAVANNSRSPGRWQNRSSRSLHFSDMTGDGAGFDFQNGRSQTVPYTNERNPFAPRRPLNHPQPSKPHSTGLYPSDPASLYTANSYPLDPVNHYQANSSQSTHYPASHYPSSHSLPSHSLPNHYPSSHYHPNQYQYPPHPNPPNLHSPHPHPLHPNPPNIHPPNPYTAPSTQFMPSYDNANFQRQPPMNSTYHAELEMENVDRKLRDLDKMEQQIAKKQQEIDKYERDKRKQDEASERREARRRDEERMKRLMQRQIKAELDKNYFPKRDTKDGETRSEPGRRQREYDPRLLEYLVPLVAERQIENSWRIQEGRREGETDRLLQEFAEFYENKLRRQDGRRSHMGSMRGSWDEPGRGRLEAVPRELYQDRTHDALRHQVEDIVIDVLRHFREEGQETDYAPEKPMFLTAEHGRGNLTRLLPQATNFASERDWVSEGQRPSWIHWQDDRDSGKATGPASPTVGRGGSSSRTSALVADESQEKISRNLGDDGCPLPVNARRDGSGEGRGRPGAAPNHRSTKGNPNSNATPRRHRAPTCHDADQEANSSDESEVEDRNHLRRSPRLYTINPNRRGPENTVPKVPPPEAPDPPPASCRKQPLGEPGARERRGRVAHEDMQDENWRLSSHFSGTT